VLTACVVLCLDVRPCGVVLRARLPLRGIAKNAILGLESRTLQAPDTNEGQGVGLEVGLGKGQGARTGPWAARYHRTPFLFFSFFIFFVCLFLFPSRSSQNSTRNLKDCEGEAL